MIGADTNLPSFELATQASSVLPLSLLTYVLSGRRATEVTVLFLITDYKEAMLSYSQILTKSEFLAEINQFIFMCIFSVAA